MVTSIVLDDGLKSRIENLASLRHCSSDLIMQEALNEYIERAEARENFKQEALNSWTTYQHSGKHLTGEEIKDWLTTWGSDTSVELPQCHE